MSLPTVAFFLNESWKSLMVFGEATSAALYSRSSRAKPEKASMLRTSGALFDCTLVRTTSLMLSQDWTSRLTLMSGFCDWNPEMTFCQLALVASLYDGTSRSSVVAPPCAEPPPDEPPLLPNPQPVSASAATVATAASRVVVRTRVLLG